MFTSLLLSVLFFGFGEAFFLFTEKHEPVLFCVKICPLYCSPRRHDEDAKSLNYSNIKRSYNKYDYGPHPDHTYIKQQPQPTTPGPKTTTETEYFYPDYYEDHAISYYRFAISRPKSTTQRPTTFEATTTEKHFYTDFYDDYIPPYYYYWRPKPTTRKPTTSEPTTTHKHFYPNFHDEYGFPYHYNWRPKPTTEIPTTTEMPTTTTEEPTFICMVCKKKCGFPPTDRK